MPVTFEYFTAVKQGKGVLLTWKTPMPEGTEQFEVMRSVNGRDYSVIGVVPALLMQTGYAFTDNNITGNNKLYYRIRAVEHGEQTCLTAIRFVDFVNNNHSMVMIYPNPVRNARFLMVINKPGVKTINVFGGNGTLFKHFTFIEQAKDITTESWPKGFYLLSIKTDDGSVVTEKIMVQ